MRLVLTRTLVVISSLVASILAAELVARIVGIPPRFGHMLPVSDVPTRTVDGVTLWEDRHPRATGADVARVAKIPGAFTIIGLGDSIMYGVDEETTYLDVARQIIADRSPRTVEILNLAVPGYNSRQEAATYKEIDGLIKPNLVLVHFWQNDFEQSRMVGGYVVTFGDISEDGRLVVRALPCAPRLSDFLLVHSRLYDLVTHAVVLYRQHAQRDDWHFVTDALADIHERVRRAGGRMLVLSSPDLSGPSPQPTAFVPMLQRYAAEQGFEVIDLTPWLAGTTSQQVGIDRCCHFNAEGHRRIGERLAEYLLQNDLRE